MIHFIYLSVIVGLIALVALYAYYYEQQRKTGLDLFEQFVETVAENEALEKGFVEVTDAYETDSLQYEDTIEKLNEREALSQSRIAEKHHKIMRQNEQIDDLQIQVGTLRGENLHLRRQLDMSQVVITNHDLNCLPHIVLKSMEPQEETLPGL